MDSSSTSPKAGIYVLGNLVTSPAATASDLINSDFDYIVLASMHVSNTGGINFNNTPVTSLGSDVLNALKDIHDSGKKIYASFGGGGLFHGHSVSYYDYSDIKALIQAHPPSQNPFFTNLSNMFSSMYIDGLDHDLEIYSGQSGYQAFLSTIEAMNEWLFQNGYESTAAPYQEQDFWTEVLKSAVKGGKQQMSFMNIQNAAPGVSNWVSQWQSQATAIGLSNVAAFCSAGLQVSGTSPSQVEQQFKYITTQGLYGGWLWNYDNLDRSFSAMDYSQAIKNGLS